MRPVIELLDPTVVSNLQDHRPICHVEMARMPADRRGAGRRRGGRGGAHAVVLGVISNPRRPDVRGWIRAHTTPSPALLHVFVIGKRGLSETSNAIGSRPSI